MLRHITQTLTIHRHTAIEDARGNLEEAPIGEWPTLELPVYAVAPTGQQIPFADGRQPIIGDRTIYTPIDAPRPDVDDLISFPNEDGYWVLTGEPQVWDNNPHVHITHQRGVVIVVERRQR